MKIAKISLYKSYIIVFNVLPEIIHVFNAKVEKFIIITQHYH